MLHRTIGPLRSAPLKPSPARVVGNVLYYITSDILLRLFEFHEQFDVIVIMVQREVADRIAARPVRAITVCSRYGAALYEGRKSFYSAAERIRASAQSPFFGAAIDHRAQV